MEDIESEIDIPDIVIISARWLLTVEYKKLLSKIYKCSLKFDNNYILFDTDTLNQLRQVWLKIIQNGSASSWMKPYILKDKDSKQRFKNILLPFI